MTIFLEVDYLRRLGIVKTNSPFNENIVCEYGADLHNIPCHSTGLLQFSDCPVEGSDRVEIHVDSDWNTIIYTCGEQVTGTHSHYKDLLRNCNKISFGVNVHWLKVIVEGLSHD